MRDRADDDRLRQLLTFWARLFLAWDYDAVTADRIVSGVEKRKETVASRGQPHRRDLLYQIAEIIAQLEERAKGEKSKLGVTPDQLAGLEYEQTESFLTEQIIDTRENSMRRLTEQLAALEAKALEALRSISDREPHPEGVRMVTSGFHTLESDTRLEDLREERARVIQAIHSIGLDHFQAR